MSLYKNKYRVESIRAQWWDYASNAAYFITICTHERFYYFGNIMDGNDAGPAQMQLSAIGQSAQDCWFDIPNHFGFVKLGAFVVMPNHVHGIIIIDKPEPVSRPPVETQYFASPPNGNTSVPGGNAPNHKPPAM